jgi:hypothetical protein
MSRAVLERYSHIRIAAKRGAVSGIRLYEEVLTIPQNSEGVPVAEGPPQFSDFRW